MSLNKSLPIKNKPSQSKTEEPKKRVAKPTLDSLKAMSNEEKLQLCAKLGVQVPRYDSDSPSGVVHMHLLHLLKLHYHYTEERKKAGGRPATRPTTVQIHESAEEIRSLNRKMDILTEMVRQLLK
jgi:hypothetical protein